MLGSDSTLSQRFYAILTAAVLAICMAAVIFMVIDHPGVTPAGTNSEIVAE